MSSASHATWVVASLSGSINGGPAHEAHLALSIEPNREGIRRLLVEQLGCPAIALVSPATPIFQHSLVGVIADGDRSLSQPGMALTQDGRIDERREDSRARAGTSAVGVVNVTTAGARA